MSAMIISTWLLIGTVQKKKEHVVVDFLLVQSGLNCYN